jgi:hypothetical protein
MLPKKQIMNIPLDIPPLSLVIKYLVHTFFAVCNPTTCFCYLYQVLKVKIVLELINTIALPAEERMAGNSIKRASQGSHDPNHTKAFTVLLQILNFLVHVPWYVGCFCSCLVESVAEVGAVLIINFLLWRKIT